MANLTIPSNPTEGDIISVNGKEIVYDSDKSRWNAYRLENFGALPSTSVSYAQSLPPSYVLSLTSTFTLTAGVATASGLFTDPEGVAMSPDGTKLYAMWVDAVEQFSLSTPWDLSTAVSQGTNDGLSHSNQRVQGLAFNPEGTICVWFDEGGGGQLYQYSCATPFDIRNTSMSYNSSIGEVTVGDFIGSTGSEAGVCEWLDDGNKLLLFGRSRSNIAIATVTTPYTLQGFSRGTVRDGQSTDVGSYGSGGVSCKPDGTEFHMIGGSFVGDSMKKFPMTTPFDVSTVDNDALLGGTGILPNDVGNRVWVSADGSKIVYSAGSKTIRLMEVSV